MTPEFRGEPRGEPRAEPAGRALPGADWLTLLKPRIASFVFLAAYTGGWLAAGLGADPWRLGEAALLITLVAGASSAFNQVLERDTDARMRRTANRPLAAGRISARDAILYAAFLASVGVIGLATRFGLLAALLSLATLAAYVVVYTPLKRATTLNTLVGAVPGAMPPLIGHVALSGEVGVWGLSLFAVIFAWQFPHFLAIAWLYREDYAAAGLRMLTAVEAGPGVAGRQALLYAVALVPVSLYPALREAAGPVYVGGVTALGLAYVAAAAWFAHRETEASARTLLRVSLVHLPLVLALALVDALVLRP